MCIRDRGYEVEKTNGYFGVATAKALSSFQIKNKLDATGVMDTDTADILYSNNARPKVDPTPSPTPKPKSTPTAKPANTPKNSATPKVGGDSIGTTKTADPGTQPESTPKTGGGGNVSAATGSVDGFIATAMALEQRQNAHLSYRNMAGRRKIHTCLFLCGAGSGQRLERLG